jgi:hypothetical protein
MKTYKDKVSGETLYVSQSYGFTEYYKDKAMTVHHRRDGPAVEGVNGRNVWWVNDQLHRLDGPAVEGVNGRNVWWVYGVIITSMYSNGSYKGPETLQNALIN